MFSKKSIVLTLFSIFILVLAFYFFSKTNFMSLSSSLPIEDNKQHELVKEEITQPTLATPSPTPTLTTKHNETTTLLDDPVQILLHSMTLTEKIGQLFILGFEGKTYSTSSKLHTWISDFHIGNFIVFKRNITSNEQLKLLIEQIDHYNLRGDIPIWIGIDQEGGNVNRLVTKYPSAEQYALWNDTVITYAKHSEMAQEINTLGIDINFGPVLDINSNPKNPVINSRAFGTTADTVMLHTEAVIKAYQDEKLIAVGKHFPGHGDTNEDSHYHLPVITKSWDELLSLELKPFQNAIKAEIPSIMVGHLLLTEIDTQYPASLSKTLIKQKLIEELGFKGLIMTDDLVMEGVLSQYSMAEASVLALEAGAHLLIVGHDADLQFEAIEAVTDAVMQERITLSDLDAKVYDILKYKLDHL